MGKLIFNPDEVRKIWEHSKASKYWRKVDGEERYEPYLLLVHDQGVYLMSPGIPKLEHPGIPERSWVAYAKGCNAELEEHGDWWQTSQDLVGGDDFAEELPIETFDDMFARFGDRLTAVDIEMDEDNISIGCKYREAEMSKKKQKKKAHKPTPKKKSAKRKATPAGMEW